MDGESQPPTFKKATVNSMMQTHFTDKKTKANQVSVKLMTELLREFATEGAVRSGIQAKREGLDMITIEHFEKILPQLLLDF
ncbi:PREDICTED: centromere protein X-like [Priapulus caudatus]|uniref:Centromere protein X n=1 Tax=Priapulus caudatus TaxID=37621 RepID=A0ABM1DXE2_PRICU|nr:PREDICTED: centromere protein X-like [Priapulus caudatus]